MKVPHLCVHSLSTFGPWKADFYNRAFFFADAHRFLPGPDNLQYDFSDFVPVFTVVGFILMFYSENDDMQNVFLFLSVGLVAINLILMEFMQNTIEKEERIKIAVLTEQNQKIVLQIIRTGKKSMSVSEEKCTIIKISFPRSRH